MRNGEKKKQMNQEEMHRQKVRGDNCLIFGQRKKCRRISDNVKVKFKASINLHMNPVHVYGEWKSKRMSCMKCRLSAMSIAA